MLLLACFSISVNYDRQTVKREIWRAQSATNELACPQRQDVTTNWIANIEEQCAKKKNDEGVCNYTNCSVQEGMTQTNRKVRGNKRVNGILVDRMVYGVNA